MEASEDEFVSAVDSSMGLMKIVMSNTMALKALTQLASVQLQYHKVR
jgi:Bin/amphiphysin/Rvs domain for vesicular trafficking